MKVSQVIDAAGLVGVKTDTEILNGLRGLRARALANEGTNIYSTSRIAATGATDVSKMTEPYIIQPVREGHWQIYERQPDGSYVKYGPESIGLDDLKSQVQKLNAKVRGKANKANEETIAVLTSEQMKRTGCDYTTAFCNIRKQKPELFWTMRDPAAHTPRKK